MIRILVAHMIDETRFVRSLEHSRISSRVGGTTGNFSWAAAARPVDRLVAAALLILVAPLMSLVAATIAMTGQDPIFRQWRVGSGCRLFRIIKFRTVWTDKAPPKRPGFVSSVQRRMFDRLSRVLRATGLDELPQFLNVVRGEMALIGPRPLIPEDYERLPAGREIRVSVLPGITGLAQINGGQRLCEAHKLVFDIYYVQRKSMVLDMYIVGCTVLRLIGFNNITERTDATLLFHAVRHVGECRLSEVYPSDLWSNPRSTR